MSVCSWWLRVSRQGFHHRLPISPEFQGPPHSGFRDSIPPGLVLRNQLEMMSPATDRVDQWQRKVGLEHGGLDDGLARLRAERRIRETLRLRTVLVREVMRLTFVMVRSHSPGIQSKLILLPPKNQILDACLYWSIYQNPNLRL